MLTRLEEKTIALAGIFQNCYAVQNLAQSGKIDQKLFDTAVNAIFSTDPEHVTEIYGGISNLQTGFEIIEKQMNNHNKQNGNSRNNDLTRYSISVLFLASKLLKDQAKLKKMAEGIERARAQSEHFGLDHTNIYASLGGLYSETISLMNPRIMVSGEPEYLNNPENANRIRTLLLAAIRSAILWKQLGGSRWQLLFKRKQIAQTAKKLSGQV